MRGNGIKKKAKLFLNYEVWQERNALICQSIAETIVTSLIEARKQGDATTW